MGRLGGPRVVRAGMFLRVIDPQPPLVRLRTDQQIPDSAVLMVRFDILDLNMVIKGSLNFWTAYGRVLTSLGLPGRGALTLSAFALMDEWTVEGLAGHCDHSMYRQCQLGTLRDAGVVIWPTEVFRVDGEPDPRNDVHYDIVVEEVPGVVPDKVGQGTPAERRAARKLLEPNFLKVLDLMGPPKPVSRRP